MMKMGMKMFWFDCIEESLGLWRKNNGNIYNVFIILEVSKIYNLYIVIWE